jgi:hypothetical protein
MAAKELQINEMFKGPKINLFYERHQIRKNGNEKMDEEDAANGDCICLNDFHGKMRNERFEAMS